MYFARVLLLSTALIFTSCTAPKIPSDTLVALVEIQPRNLHPLYATDSVSQKIDSLIHAALVRSDAKMHTQPELASEINVNPSYTKFVFKLKQNAQFQDGSPLTAKDVVWALEQYRKAGPHGVALQQVKNIEAKDASRIVIETKIPQPFLLSDLVLFKVFKQGPEKIIGAGAFRLVREQLNEIEIERVSSENATKKPKKIIFRFVRDDATRYQQFLRGDGSVLLSALGIEKTFYLRTHLPKDVQIMDAPGINFSYLCFNFRDPRLANLKVRQAIAHAIDIDGILNHRLHGLGVKATGAISQVLQKHYNPRVPHYEFDPAKAERLLDEAGFPRKGSENWRFDLTFKASNDRFSYDMARLIGGELKKVGINVQYQILDPATTAADMNSGNFQIFHSRWVGITNPSIYFRVFHSSQIKSGMNRGAYFDAEMDRLIEKGMSELDDLKRKEYFDRVQKLAAEELPYINLWHWNNTFIGRNSMRSIEIYPNGSFQTLADLEL